MVDSYFDTDSTCMIQYDILVHLASLVFPPHNLGFCVRSVLRRFLDLFPSFPRPHPPPVLAARPQNSNQGRQRGL